MGTSRFSSQLLTGEPATDVMSVIRRLLATQAQDLRGARLAVRVRSTGLTAADVDAELESGRAVVSWLNRGTLHLVAAEDYWWLHELIAPSLVTGNARRLRQEGVSDRQAERGVEVIADSLSSGPMTRGALREPLTAARVPDRQPGARAPADARDPAWSRRTRADAREGAGLRTRRPVAGQATARRS